MRIDVYEHLKENNRWSHILILQVEDHIAQDIILKNKNNHVLLRYMFKAECGACIYSRDFLFNEVIYLINTYKI